MKILSIKNKLTHSTIVSIHLFGSKKCTIEKDIDFYYIHIYDKQSDIISMETISILKSDGYIKIENIG